MTARRHALVPYKSAWAALILSRKKEILRYLATLKPADAKAFSLKMTMQVVPGTEVHLVARTWKDGK